jgi:cytochrome c oxidase subunit 2
MFRVIILIIYIIFYMLINLKYYKFLSEGTFIETVWSIVPAFLLIILVFPSIKVLYIVEDIKTPSFTFKVVAHQWYWTYVSPFFHSFVLSCSLLESFSFDSVFLEDSSELRTLSRGASLFIPVNSVSRFLVTSRDVIHSFALPSIGLKVDALPGRINQIFANPSRVGVFVGQCSEICGSNHSFMPISLSVCGLGDFEYSLYGAFKSFINDGDL